MYVNKYFAQANIIYGMPDYHEMDPWKRLGLLLDSSYKIGNGINLSSNFALRAIFRDFPLNLMNANGANKNHAKYGRRYHTFSLFLGFC